MEIKTCYPNFTQKEIEKEIGCSDSTFKRFYKI